MKIVEMSTKAMVKAKAKAEAKWLYLKNASKSLHFLKACC